jgi:hypothetical protein
MKLKLYSGVLLWLMFGTFPNVLSAQNVNVSAPLFSEIVESVEKEA